MSLLLLFAPVGGPVVTYTTGPRGSGFVREAPTLQRPSAVANARGSMDSVARPASAGGRRARS